MVPEEWPLRIGACKCGDTLQNPAYRLADASDRYPAGYLENEGFGVNAPDPSPIRGLEVERAHHDG
jgi:hypothetical protein